ncbi:hypothetical protein CEXT_59141 [Caerostris extrusa]|uniref:Uncharacterized protein n=1 Tax=Caerostris extrusa TaxID=172846 RepID=A0AAV4U609_CAEEX|nr:hypothetical protein CEXT_59141 [Caerostris extrusa]
MIPKRRSACEIKARLLQEPLMEPRGREPTEEVIYFCEFYSDAFTVHKTRSRILQRILPKCMVFVNPCFMAGVVSMLQQLTRISRFTTCNIALNVTENEPIAGE